MTGNRLVVPPTTNQQIATMMKVDRSLQKFRMENEIALQKPLKCLSPISSLGEEEQYMYVTPEQIINNYWMSLSKIL